MDPNLFHLDWERVGEVLAAIVVLSFILERALAILFESRSFLKRFESAGIKEWIAAAVCIAVCIVWKFDAISMIVLTDKTTVFGEIVTGAVIAGGSNDLTGVFCTSGSEREFHSGGTLVCRRRGTSRNRL